MADGTSSTAIQTSWPMCQSSQLSHEDIEQIFQKIHGPLMQCFEKHKLNPDALPVKTIYIPLAAWIKNKTQESSDTFVTGLNGSQGSGKSTLSEILTTILNSGFNLNAVTFSIDDIYKTHDQRQQLGIDIHPLFKTRGVPGTHDVDLGINTIKALKAAQKGTKVQIPQFLKSIDDRATQDQWPEIEGPVDVIILEGWCVGAQAQDQDNIEIAINALEEKEDQDAVWRKYVNQQLQGEYQTLFEMLDVLIMLKAPAMESIFSWRKQQEDKLKARLQQESNTSDAPVRTMDDEQLKRFIQHYERLTRLMLDEMPNRADVTLVLDDDHKICNVVKQD